MSSIKKRKRRRNAMENRQPSACFSNLIDMVAVLFSICKIVRRVEHMWSSQPVSQPAAEKVTERVLGAPVADDDGRSCCHCSSRFEDWMAID